MPDHLLESGDSPELEALFESIAKQQASQQEASSIEVDGANPQAALAIYAQIGQMTRKLHDALRELGYDKSLEKVADAIPDAKDRLGYIATLTANAAERVLNATDIARPIQDELQSQSASLSGRWDQLFANQLSVDDFKLLAADTRRFLAQAPQQTAATNAQLLEIVMAQDFQDLTGQVIKKVMDMVKTLESELLTVLIEYLPAEKKVELGTDLLQGPVVNPDGRSDVVTNQQQVDDLLESLGF
ncbi:protein phosphatase CheZ [Vogesella sp. LYT5W]|uniref:Protein phosphatase CheZ n=1 Tax=Vogesella margarita TaxID=2984199 RepID=A0ABT5IQX9_9NEIS|nr:protein phosphatase CheZ [Vogesella margarita]MDC7714971.1 protein phosphatase CheZ [Vogesella margarita]